MSDFLNKLENNLLSQEFSFNTTEINKVKYINIGFDESGFLFVFGDFKDFKPIAKRLILSILKGPSKHLCQSHYQNKSFYVLIHKLDEDEFDTPQVNFICRCKIDMWASVYGFEDNIIVYLLKSN